MSELLPDEEFDIARVAPVDTRYDYAVRRIGREAALWSLATEDGWVLFADNEDREVIPVWPHPRYAELCALNEFADAKAVRITLDEWVEQWTPALAKHQRVVAVFPDPDGNAIVVEPSEFEDDLLFDYEALEDTTGEEDDDDWEIELED